VIHVYATWLIRCVTWLIHYSYICDMSYSYTWHYEFFIHVCVTCLIRTCNMTNLWLTCVTWLIRMSDMLKISFTYVWHVSFVRVIWFNHYSFMYDMSHLHVWHDEFIIHMFVICLIRIFDMTNSWFMCMRHVAFDEFVMTNSSCTYVWHYCFIRW